MSDTQRLSYETLMTEYLHIQSTSEGFDSKALQFKTWSVTITGTGLAAAYVEGTETLVLIALFASLLFWCVDAIWKTFQWAYLDRLVEIESAATKPITEGTAIPVVPMKITTSWISAYNRGMTVGERRQGRARTFLTAFFSIAVVLPHAGVVVGSLLLWLVAPPGQ